MVRINRRDSHVPCSGNPGSDTGLAGVVESKIQNKTHSSHTIFQIIMKSRQVFRGSLTRYTQSKYHNIFFIIIIQKKINVDTGVIGIR